MKTTVNFSKLFQVLDKYSESPTKPPVQVEKLPWQSHFEYQSKSGITKFDIFCFVGKKIMSGSPVFPAYACPQIN